MDVTCERCSTEYEFDETLLSGRGTTVKCTNCGHVFRVYPPGHQDIDRATSNWKIRHMDTGRVELIESLRDLQHRISQGQLSTHDEISRGDQAWKPLGAIAELETFFVVARNRSSQPNLQAQRPGGRPGGRPRQKTLLGAAAPVTRSPSASAPNAPFTRAKTVIGHGTISSNPPEAYSSEVAKTEADLEPPVHRKPIPTRSSYPPPFIDEDDDLPTLPKRQPLWLYAIVLAAVLGALAWWQWPRVSAWLGANTENGTLAPLLEAANNAIQTDTIVGYEQAIAHYSDALAQGADVPTVTAASSTAHALLAQALRENQRGDSKANVERITGLAKKAQQLAEQAQAQDPKSAGTSIALADGIRLTGDLQGAQTELDRAMNMPLSRTAEFYRVRALIAIDRADGDFALARNDAEQAVERSEAPRYRLMLARSLFAQNQVEAAKAEINAVLQMYPTHLATLSLLKRVDSSIAAPPQEINAETIPTEVESPENKEALIEAETKPEQKPPKKPVKKRRSVAKDAYDERHTDSTDELVDGRPPDAQDFGWYIRKARAALAGGQLDRARVYYESALESRPGSGEATLGLGQVAMKAQNPSLALRYFRAATQRGHAEGYFDLAGAYRKLGKTELAIAAYYMYTKRVPGGKRTAAAERPLHPPPTEIKDEPEVASTPDPPAADTNPN